MSADDFTLKVAEGIREQWLRYAEEERQRAQQADSPNAVDLYIRSACRWEGKAEGVQILLGMIADAKRKVVIS